MIYPHVVQFETRRHEYEQQRALLAALGAGRRAARPLVRLPRRERWKLARLAATVDVPAGKPLVRQGAFADAFFLIERGRVTVTRNDHHIAELGPGDFFGEVALLHGGAPTASVVAATDVRVRVVPRIEFRPALRALPTLAHTARSLARQRLHPARTRARSSD